MEQWYKEQISKHLPDLIRVTTCNAILIAKLRGENVLSESDAETLSTYQNRMEQASKFYDIIMQRKGVFEILKQALQETRQTGAVALLTKCGTNVHELYRNHGAITYDRKSVIGCGCYNTKVFKGQYDNRIVAVKWISSVFVDPEKALREVEILKTVDLHDNIIRYFGAEEREEFVLIALELCETNLVIYLTSNEKFSPISPQEMLQQMTSGLAHLHENGILHRDLKPENVLISSRNRVGKIKLADFGTSRKAIDGRYSMSARSSRFGTEGWVAPEVLPLIVTGSNESAEKHYTTAADVFALGCIFYYVITKGQHPFGDGVHRQANIVDYKPSVSMTHLKYAVEPFIRDVLLMMSKSPIRRPSAEEVLAFPILSSQHPSIWKQKSYKKEADAKLDEMLSYISEDAGVEESPDDTDESIAAILQPTNSFFTKGYPGVSEFLRSKQNTAFIIKSLDRNLSTCRIRDTINNTLPIAELSSTCELENLESVQGDVIVVTCHWLNKDNVAQLTDSLNKIIFVTEEVVGEIGQCIVENDSVEWHDLTRSYQRDILDSLNVVGFEDCSKDVGDFFKMCVPRYPEIFSPVLQNELLISFINSSVHSSQLAKLISRFVENRLSVCCSENKISLDRLLVEISPVVMYSFPSMFGRNVDDHSENLLLQHLVKLGLLKEFSDRETGMKQFRFAYDCIGFHIVAQISQSRVLNQTVLKIDSIFRPFFNFKFITKKYPALYNENSLNEFVHLTSKNHADVCIENDMKLSYNICNFHHPILPLFLNMFLTNAFSIANLGSQGINSDSLQNFLYACIKSNFHNLIRSLMGDERIVLVFKNKHSVLLAAEYGDTITIDLVWKGFLKANNSSTENCFLEYLLPDGNVLFITPLHVTISRGDISVTEYFLRALSFDGTLGNPLIYDLIHYAVSNTKQLDVEVVGRRAQIIQLFTKTDRHLINRKIPYENCTAILMGNVHIDLILNLITSGCDVLSTMKNSKSTVMHIAATYMNSEEYHKLSSMLVNKNASQIFGMLDINSCLPLHLAVRFFDLSSLTMQLFAASGKVNFGQDNQEQESPFRWALYGKRSANTFKMLLSHITKDLRDGGKKLPDWDVFICHATHFGSLNAIKAVLDFLQERGYEWKCYIDKHCSRCYEFNELRSFYFTPLHYAVLSDSSYMTEIDRYNIVQFLLQNGARSLAPLQQNNKNNTPYTFEHMCIWAKKYTKNCGISKDIADLLAKHGIKVHPSNTS